MADSACVLSLLNGRNSFAHSCDGYYSHCFAEQERFKYVQRLNYAYIAEDDNSNTRKVLLCLPGNLVENCDRLGNLFCKTRIVTMFITI